MNMHQVDIVPDESAMYVLFSIVDWPANLNKVINFDENSLKLDHKTKLKIYFFLTKWSNFLDK